MVKFPEADARKMKNIYVCRKCKSKIRAQPMKVIQGKVACRKCASHQLRTVRKK